MKYSRKKANPILDWLSNNFVTVLLTIGWLGAFYLFAVYPGSQEFLFGLVTIVAFVGFVIAALIHFFRSQ